jgi:GR25 family glycosyltransferase involved in LPS biosynthesis
MKVEVESRIQIAIFAFNRPSHLEKCLTSVKLNKEAIESDLTIYVDGPRSETDLVSVNEVLAIAERVTGFNSILVVKSQINKGLANSIVDGVSRILDKNAAVIVLEDDLIVSPFFLEFMSRSLKKFQNDKVIASIHGYLPSLSEEPQSPFFLRGADCWGWATWSDRWKSVEWNGTKLRDELIEKKLVKKFNHDGNYNYFGMLERQLNGENDSWAIRWHASMFLQNRLTLYPNKSLVINTGMDGTGRHSGISEDYDTKLSSTPITIENLKVEESIKMRQEFSKFFANTKRKTKGSITKRVRRKLLQKIEQFVR